MLNNIFSSNLIQYQNTFMFKKVYGVDLPYLTVFRKKIMKFTFSIQILKILNLSNS